MKTILTVLSVTMLFLIADARMYAQDSSEQDSTGLPGDNFSLHGALEMFKKAASPEEFEKLLNTQDNHVNNLDLNEDGDIDYVRVVDKSEKDVHAFVLQVSVSETENQDVAVIELEKTGDEKAILQIVGDEDLYGEQTIVEPFEEGGGDDDGDAILDEGHGPYAGAMHVQHARIIVNVWVWPCVRFVYAPAYVVWVSPWGWHRHPAWWHPWRPLRWHVFHPLRAHYHHHFRVVHTHRVVHAHRVYTPVRASSVTVRTRHHANVTHYRTTRTTTIHTKAGTAKVKTTRTGTRVGKRKR